MWFSYFPVHRIRCCDPFQNWYCHISHTVTRQGKMISSGLSSLLPPDISSVLEKSLSNSEFCLSNVLLLTFSTLNDVADVLIFAGMIIVELNCCCVCCWLNWLLYFDIWTNGAWFVALEHSIFNPIWSIFGGRGNPCSNEFIPNVHWSFVCNKGRFLEDCLHMWVCSHCPPVFVNNLCDAW